MKAESALAEAEREREDAEREALRDSPEGLNLFDEKVKHRQAVSQFEAEKKRHTDERATWEADVAEAKTYQVQKMANEIAAEHGVDASTLVSLTDGSRDKMEKLAKVLPRKDEVPGPSLQRPPKPASIKGSAGHGPRTVEQLERMDSDQYAEYWKERQTK